MSKQKLLKIRIDLTMKKRKQKREGKNESKIQIT